MLCLNLGSIKVQLGFQLSCIESRATLSQVQESTQASSIWCTTSLNLKSHLTMPTKQPCHHQMGCQQGFWIQNDQPQSLLHIFKATLFHEKSSLHFFLHALKQVSMSWKSSAFIRLLNFLCIVNLPPLLEFQISYVMEDFKRPWGSIVEENSEMKWKVEVWSCSILNLYWCLIFPTPTTLSSSFHSSFHQASKSKEESWS